MAIKIAGTEVINDNKELVLAKLTEIDASIADTAVDIFVYDTSKDSDGGAWRKRTQGTSWYNETLNTATRGSRKEFPAVAVIVAEATKVTIYDGDDPDLPMWMVFNGSSSNLLYLPALSLTSVTALNGIIGVGKISHQFTTLEFISDTARIIATDGIRNFSGASISQRNDSVGIGSPISSTSIVNSTINDVAMTVLPNAPIDAATGLPVPTIAVATAGGVSVIKDDGIVADSSSPASIESLAFTDAYDLVWGQTGSAMLLTYYPNWETDGFPYDALMRGKNFTSSSDYPYVNTVSLAKGTVSANGIVYLGDVDGVSYVTKTADGSEGTALVSYIDYAYNTGWMNGDIKLATLSDTDDTNVTATNLVVNGTFDSDTTWLKDGGWVISGGVASCSGSGTSFIYPPSGAVTEGQQVIIKLTISSYTSGNLSISSSTGNPTTSYMTSTGTYTFSQTITGNSSWYIRSDNFVGSIDNVELYAAEEDRSVNGNGLQVFGTVTKSAVATGADLVGSYHSSGHYMQPYNSDFDFGTGDFCHMFWVKWDGTTTFDFLTRQARSGSAYGSSSGWYHKLDASGAYLFGIIPEGGSPVASTLDIDASGFITQWTHITVVRRNGVISIYRDGVFKDSDTNTTSISNTAQDSVLYVGTIMYNSSENTRFKGSLALVRISATAPSPEQIKKIYEDEKVLFQENAQATLYGSSDAVTALAYDDSTELLHVGTSEGRSVFQGLRRVDNTTTAVGAAISASNGLVADE